MPSFQKHLFICGVDERSEYQPRQISHVIAATNPGAPPLKWSNAAQLQLWFGDVASETDAKRCSTVAPRIEDVQRAVEFFRGAWCGSSKVLVTCDYGASRSPALAYLFIADQLGPGREAEAFNIMLEIRRAAVPNGLIVRLGDAYLKRDGALLKPLEELNAKLNTELFG